MVSPNMQNEESISMSESSSDNGTDEVVANLKVADNIAQNNMKFSFELFSEK